jgi:hypothetical protein
MISLVQFLRSNYSNIVDKEYHFRLTQPAINDIKMLILAVRRACIKHDRRTELLSVLSQQSTGFEKGKNTTNDGIYPASDSTLSLILGWIKDFMIRRPRRLYVLHENKLMNPTPVQTTVPPTGQLQ